MTIKEVAQLAGVSAAAVSRYMNGGPISGEKSERIRAVIERTGYRPNQAAQSMRTGTSGQIGVIIPRVNSGSASEILDGVMERLQEEQYMMILGLTQGSHEAEMQYLEIMQDNKVAGIILMGTGMTPALRDSIAGAACPVIVTGQKFSGVSCVFHDDYHAVKDLTKRALSRGRTELAYIGVSEDDVAVGAERRRGAEDAVREAGLAPEDCVWKITGFSFRNGEETMREIIQEHPSVNGVICATDTLAPGAMKALRDAGKRIPDDVVIAGVGDNWADQVSVPPLTSVHLYYRQCGVTAANILLNRMETEAKGSPVTQTRLECTVMERGTL